jgi:Cu(I)/Ag(I) efflux system membrane protein CusA/SilA
LPARSVLYEHLRTYVDVVPRRDAIARYGWWGPELKVIERAIGASVDDGGGPPALHGQRPLQGLSQFPGEASPIAGATSGSRGRESHFRDQVPLGELADVKVVEGPPMLRDEAGLWSFVYVDLEPWRDLGGYVNDAKAVVAEHRQMASRPCSGMYVKWTGQ